jgi:adenylosuccinate lyase
MDIFDNISPLDYRYYGRDENARKMLAPYLSENARIRYHLRVEAALVRVLAMRGVCPQEVAREVEKACREVKAGEVYEEEERIRHDIRALANAIRRRVSDRAKPFVHFTATSFDIINTAESLRFREFSENVLVPALIRLEKSLIEIALREKDTIQIGRTHGQHAEPITFGFAIAEYVSRLGNCIEGLRESSGRLRGKFSGAVGAYNASSLFFDDPQGFERELLKELGLEPATHSTQITEPEYMLDFMHSAVSCLGVLANLADDMRHLQRSEIAEVGEAFQAGQVGSSTMPHKRNPINLENIKSMWKAFAPRMGTLYMDQLSEHQRDLTNSASSRFASEMLAALYLTAGRAGRIMGKLVVDKESMERNLSLNREMIVAEPLYILLAAHGHPDAHECVKQLTLESQKTGRPLRELVASDEGLKPYLEKFTREQRAVIENPGKYTGIASRKAGEVCRAWKQRLGI